MNEIEAGVTYYDHTDDDVGEIMVLDEARGTTEVVEPVVDKSTELANIYEVGGKTFRHRCDDTESLEWKLATGDLEEYGRIDRTPYVEEIDGE